MTYFFLTLRPCLLFTRKGNCSKSQAIFHIRIFFFKTKFRSHNFITLKVLLLFYFVCTSRCAYTITDIENIFAFRFSNQLTFLFSDKMQIG